MTELNLAELEFLISVVALQEEVAYGGEQDDYEFFRDLLGKLENLFREQTQQILLELQTRKPKWEQ